MEKYLEYFIDTFLVPTYDENDFITENELYTRFIDWYRYNIDKLNFDNLITSYGFMKDKNIWRGIKTKNNHLYLKTQLTFILNQTNISHKNKILKEDSLKKAHIYCKINNLSGQITGNLIEHYIKNKNNMFRNNASLCCGDLKFNNINYEIKASNGGKEHNKFNFVQIRLNHTCNYILSAYYLNEDNIQTLGELFIFKLDKSQIKNIILLYGSYAHGTKKNLGDITFENLNDLNNNKEYCLRPKYDDNCWKHLLTFRIYEI